MSRRWSRQQWRPVEAVLDAQGDLKLVRSQENGWKIMENLCWILQIRGFLVMSAILGCSCPSAIKGNQQNQPMIRWWFGAPLGFCQEWRPRISTNWARKSTPVPYNRGWLGIPVPTISIHFQPCSIKSTVPTITRKWLWRPLESLEKSWRGRKM